MLRNGVEEQLSFRSTSTGIYV